MNETWVFEDSLLALETATKAGFKTVGIVDKNNPYKVGDIEKFSTLIVYENENLTKFID